MRWSLQMPLAWIGQGHSYVGLIPPGLHRHQWPPRSHTFGSAQTVCVYNDSARVQWMPTLRQAYPNRMPATHKGEIPCENVRFINLMVFGPY